MRALASLLALAALAAPLLPAGLADGGGPYNGLDAWHPGMGYPAPIYRAFAWVEGRGVLYHSVDPELFPTDDEIGRIYQFPNCPDLRPVLADDTPQRDSPQRRIVDVVLARCEQPTSEAEVFAIGALHRQNRQQFVNAPVIHEPYASLPDDQLFNGPPFRPRVTAYSEGRLVKVITYDVSWLPPWLGTAFPGHNVDIFLLSHHSTFVPGVTRFSVFNGAPLDLRAPSLSPLNPAPGTHRAYSPVWAVTCVVDAADPVCGSLVGPKFPGCASIASCSMLEGATLVAAPYEFLNCPIVNTDVNGDGFLSKEEEFAFPDLWKDSGFVAL